MAIEIEEKLQSAIQSHKKGDLQDAKILYMEILQTHPMHPDANHNLGIIALSLNKTDEALNLFKNALETNPSKEQFWLSYITALMSGKQFENAVAVLEQGKMRGLVGPKVEALEAQLKINYSTKNPDPHLNKGGSKYINHQQDISTKKVKTRKASVNLTKLKNSRNPSNTELNAVLDCYQKGQSIRAQNLAESLTKKYPKHPFGWKVLGALLKQNGKLEDSVLINQKVLIISPNDAETHYNLGNSLKELYRLTDAEASYKKAIEIKPDYARAYFNLGVTLQELGRLEEAEANYKEAIAINLDMAEAHCNLGNILGELGRLENAVISYKRAIAIQPNLVEAHCNLGNALKELGRLEEAVVSCEQAIILEPNNLKARTIILSCFYLLDKKLPFFEMLNYFLTEDKFDAIIGSLISRSALRYDKPIPNKFCNDSLNYTLLVDLKSRYNFEEIFINYAKSIISENKRSKKIQTLLLNGYQTSLNLFDIKNKITNQIQQIIRWEIERYRLIFKDSQEGFLKKWPSEYSLYGWLVVMKSGGELQPHIHENGWLSGSIYINVPEKLNVDSGNLVISLGKDSDAMKSCQNPKKIIDVVTGNMVLFPASLMHHTIPFESKEDRIVLAFDVIPKWR